MGDAMTREILKGRPRDDGLEDHFIEGNLIIIGAPGEIIREAEPIFEGRALRVRILRVRGAEESVVVDYSIQHRAWP